MIEISLTWGDVLAHFLIGLGVAFFLSILYRYALPRLSDYWARRSISTARTKIARLERMLTGYEADFADPRLFTARIINNAVILLGLNIAFGVLIMIGLSFHIADSLRCEFYT